MTDYRQVITIENWEPEWNNTLAAGCENWNLIDNGDFGSDMMDKWIPIYLKDAVARLDPLIDGINLTTTDVYAMQSACAYEVNFFSGSMKQRRGLNCWL